MAKIRDLQTLTSAYVRPALQAVVVDVPSRSYFGGAPQLPPGTQWPSWNGRRLTFLARFSLAELSSVLTVDWLPASGALLFFYDTAEQPRGFDPKHRESCAVLHVPDLEVPIVAGGTASDAIPAHKGIGFRRIKTRPSWERDIVRSLDLSEEEFDEYVELCQASFAGLPMHQVSGLPLPVQGDNMGTDCQLASNGQYCGDSSGYQGPRAEALKPGAKDWRLLFQFDSDDQLGVMWGDSGMLYFWVQEQEARVGRFSNTWLILQT